MPCSREEIAGMFRTMSETYETLKTMTLREEQISVLHELLNGRNVFCQLPTGFGKSLPMFLYSMIRKVPVIIISPLNSLIDAHTRFAWSLSMRVCNFVDLKMQDDTAVGDFIVIGTPEAVVNDAEVRTSLHKLFVQFPAAVIAVDEAHCIPKWGCTETISANKAQPFRDAFGKLGVLRVLASSTNPFLVMTATATAATRSKIVSRLNLKQKEVRFIVQHPVRDNTYFAVSQLPADDGEQLRSLTWIFEKAKDAITNPICTRVLVYCQTVATCGRLYEECVAYLCTAGYDRREQWKAAAIYHSGTPKETQQRVIEDLLSENGQIAVVFASTALGMGVDVKLTRHVVIYGIPDGFEDIIQMAGRGGRDGRPSECSVYFKSTDWSGKSASHELRLFLQSSNCRRRGLLDAFLENEEEINQIAGAVALDRCCDVCRRERNEPTTASAVEDETRMEGEPQRRLSDQQLQHFHQHLRIQQQSMRLYDWCMVDLTDELVAQICADADFIEYDVGFIAGRYNLLYVETAKRILSALQDAELK